MKYIEVLIKILLSLLVAASLIGNASLYIDVVIDGGYLWNATAANSLLTAVVWPVVVLLIGAVSFKGIISIKLN